MLNDLIARAEADPALAEIRRLYAESGILSWVKPPEQALMFGLAAFGTGEGRIVEVGSFQGGSACFFGAGLKRRGSGKLTCVDPFLGGPLWLGVAPHQRTLEIFRRGTRHCGVDAWIDARVGDSSAVAMAWPAEPIDCVFIDGDHSFLGALRDFECWAPKLRAGGLILIDNANDDGVPDVRVVAELLRGLGCLEDLGLLCENIAVLRLRESDPWAMLEELAAACAARGVYRPWALEASPMHARPLPSRYLASKTWADGAMDEPYQLAFMARCGPGAYGYTSSVRPEDRAILEALSRDAGDGEVVKLDGVAGAVRGLLGRGSARCRAVFCTVEEAPTYAPCLLPGGLLITRVPEPVTHEAFLGYREHLNRAGVPDHSLIGGKIIFGVYQPHVLSPDAVLASAAKAYEERPTLRVRAKAS